MGPPHQEVSLQLLGACIDLKVRQKWHLCPDEVCSRRENQSFPCKRKVRLVGHQTKLYLLPLIGEWVLNIFGLCVWFECAYI